MLAQTIKTEEFRSFNDCLIEDLEDPQYACLFLSQVLKDFEEDHEVVYLLKALENIQKAHESLETLFQKASLISHEEEKDL